MLKPFVFLLPLFFISPMIFAQYQMGNDPLRVSTSLAGTKSAMRVSSNFLQGIVGSIGSYERTLNYAYISYDNFIKPIKSGIGIYFKNGNMKNNSSLDYYNLRNTTTGICIAPKFSNGKHFPTVTVSPSFGVEWISSSLAYGAPGFENTQKKSNRIAARAGIMLNTSYFFLGTGLKYVSNNQHHYLFTSFFGGYIFKKDINSKFVFSPTINILYIESFGYPDPEAAGENYLYIDALNLNFRYQKIIFGTGIPNAMLGFQTTAWRASVSYNSGLIKANNFFDGQTSLRSLLFSLVYTGKPKRS